MIYLVWYFDNQTGDDWPCQAFETKTSAEHHIAEMTEYWRAAYAGEDVHRPDVCLCKEGHARVYEMGVRP